MSDCLVSSLALLQLYWDRDAKSYVDILVPFAVAVAPSLADQPLRAADLRASLKEQLGLDVPDALMQSVLRRGVKQKVLERRHGAVYLSDSDATRNVRTRFSADRSDFDRKLRQLTQALCAYVKDALGLEWSTEDAERHLLHHVSYHGAALLRAMRTTNGGQTSTLRRDKHAIGRFVDWVLRERADLEACLEEIVRGSLLASMVDLPGARPDPQALHGMRIAIDTRVLLEALGCYGEQPQQARYELFALLRDAGATLWAYRETINELEGILDWAQGALRNGAQPGGAPPGSVVSSFVERRVTPSQVLVIKGGIEKLLSALGVGIRQVPPYRAESGVDPLAAKHAVDTCVGSYRRDGARDHDIGVITNTHLDRGQAVGATELGSAGAVFMTTNGGLCRASGTYLRDLGYPSALPLCLPDYHLGTAAWLKSRRSLVELPRHMLIAAAASALAPPPDLWDEFLRRVEDQKAKGSVTEDDYHTLRYTADAQRALADLWAETDDGMLDVAGSVDEILRRVDQRRHAELQEQLREGQKQLREEKEQKDGYRDRLSLRDRAIDDTSTRWARVWARVVCVVASVVVVSAAVLVCFPSDSPARIVVAVSFGVVSAANIVLGFTVVAWLRPLEAWMFRRKRRQLRRDSGAPSDVPETGTGGDA